MEKIISEWSTLVKLTAEEAKTVCKMGKGAKCCAFLVLSGEGFECIRLDYPNNTSIFRRLEEGTMNAQGKGGWGGCAWEGELPEENSHDANDYMDESSMASETGCDDKPLTLAALNERMKRWPL